MEVARLVRLAALDLQDTLRPPGFDALVLVTAALGGLLAGVQPLVEPHTVAMTVLEPALFATVVFLAVRGAAGLTGLVEHGVMALYMSYPVSRPGVGLALYISRVLAPSLVTLGVPLLVASALLFPVVSGDPLGLVAMYAAYLARAVFYGVVFAVIALKAKTPGTSGVASVAFYFFFEVLSVVLAQIGGGGGPSILMDLALAMQPSIALYNLYGGVEDVSIAHVAALPVAAAALSAVYIWYFARRFEP